MLFTSGTIDKESQYIRTHAILRAHHRSMMASMSKLVLSAQLSVDNANDNISKMLSESNELLVAVRNFVITCQDIPIPVQHIDPRLLDSSEAAEKTAKIESLAAADGSRAQYALQNDLADNLEAYGTSMQESVDSIIGSIKSDQYQNNTSFSLSALLFTQFRNLSNQTGQFLGIVEDIDFDGVSSSPLLSELYACKQRLSDGVGLLFYQMQTLTDESTSIQSNVAAMEKAARHYVKNLVAERKTILEQSNATAKTTQSDAHNSDTIRNTAIEEEDETDELGKSSVLDRFSTDAETVVGTQTDPLESSVDNAATADGRSSVQSLDIEKRDQTANSPSSRSGTVVASPSSEQRSPTTPDGPSKTTAKLKKFFGDDAPAAVAAATKPTSKERPWFLQYDYDPSEIVFNMEGYVKGGTLPALVERLTMHDYLDMNFINTFLLTYRSFATSVELLELLEQRYNIVPPPNLTDEEMETWTQKKLKLVRLRVFNVLKNWLELYYNEEDHVILDRLTEFTNTTIRHSLSFSCDQLERLIRKRQEAETQGGLKKMVLTLPDPPEPILPRNRRKFRLLDIDPLEMARQLTIMDFKLYSSIRPVECLDKSWSRDANDEKGSVAVNIRASIEYCNQVTSWVSDAILSQSEIKKRSNLIKYWVQVAEKCRLLNNFNTCMAILSAFDNSSVGRLKRTWEMVGARTNQTLGNIRKLMGANRNFTEYRAIIHSINPPCIPFLGIYLQDLTFIEDGNTNYLKKSKQLINFAKRAKTAEVIREIQQYQSSLYQLKSVEELQAFIQANLQSTRDEEQLYKESLKLEPREREDEKITRLLQESGFL
ncbi:ras guanine nucleotide exchange factor domain-containing protein [Radiomyces spectabilis]|uniref:ras guanine nucleotide exchange factor domain-containing protein n=1 Tax=Radiomyces spectabilis TaxID=64574 RepID=UPI00221E9560|nr:ras guanine nucleotide exchange factor domain-containing protein [Radiomyces spectabilis]KAI8391128.1 ras guanine nucleotide exchange factor domain-containing protein [Radiomyces spectabilis]